MDTLPYQLLKHCFAGLLPEHGTQIIGMQMHMGGYLIQSDLLAVMGSDVLYTLIADRLTIGTDDLGDSFPTALGEQSAADTGRDGEQLHGVIRCTFLAYIQPSHLLQKFTVGRIVGKQ